MVYELRQGQAVPISSFTSAGAGRRDGLSTPSKAATIYSFRDDQVVDRHDFASLDEALEAAALEE